MLSIFKRDNSLSTKTHLKKLKTQVASTTNNFAKKLEDIEKFADDIHTEINKKVTKFKRMAHSLEVLVSDKDKNLKMILANELQCSVMYGLPEICTDKIEGRLEMDIVNDYIESTGKWNTFIEASNYSIDEIVKDCMCRRKFIQVGHVNDEKIILRTVVKPHIKNDEFDGVLTVSNIIDENAFERIIAGGSKLAYNKNNYKVFSLD